MEQAVSSSTLSASLPTQSIRRASVSIQAFAKTVTPRHARGQLSEDIFESSLNPSFNKDTTAGTSPKMRSLNPLTPLAGSVLSEPRAFPGNLLPSAAAASLDSSEGSGELEEKMQPRAHRRSIQKASMAIKALRAFTMRVGMSQSVHGRPGCLSDLDNELMTSPEITLQSPDANQKEPEESFTRSQQLSTLVQPLTLTVAVTAATYAGSRLAAASVAQKRFTGLEPMAAGAAVSVGSTLLSSAAAVCAVGYVGYKLNNFIHSGCERDKNDLAAQFQKKLDDHTVATDVRLDAYANQISSVLQEVGSAIEDTGSSLEQVARIVEKIAPAGDLSAIKEIQAQAARLQNIGQNTQDHQPKVPASKKSCGGCCVLQ